MPPGEQPVPPQRLLLRPGWPEVAVCFADRLGRRPGLLGRRKCLWGIGRRLVSRRWGFHCLSELSLAGYRDCLPVKTNLLREMKSTRAIPATVPRRCPKGHLPILSWWRAYCLEKPPAWLVWTAAEGTERRPLPGFGRQVSLDDCRDCQPMVLWWVLGRCRSRVSAVDCRGCQPMVLWWVLGRCQPPVSAVDCRGSQPMQLWLEQPEPPGLNPSRAPGQPPFRYPARTSLRERRVAPPGASSGCPRS